MKKTFVAVMFSNFVGAGFGFLLTVFLARVLDVESFGKANFVFSTVAVLCGIADFGFNNTVVIFYNRYAEAPGDPLLTINTVYARFLAAVSLVAIPCLALFGRFYSLSTEETAVIYVSFICYSIYRYLTSIHQATGAWRRFNFLLVANSVIKFLAVALVVAVVARFTSFPVFSGMLAGYLCYSLLALAVACAMTWRRMGLRRRPDAGQVRDLYRILLPLGAAALVVIVCMRFDSMAIQKYLGPRELGIYSAANTLAFAFPLITGSLMNVLLREVSAGDACQLNRILAGQKRFLPYLVGLLALALAAAGTVVPLLFGPRYADAVGIFRVLLIPYIGGVFFTPLESYYYASEPRTVLGLKIWQTMVVVLGLLAMIGPLGLYGVTLAILLSRVTGWIFIYGKSLRTLRAAGGFEAAAKDIS